MQSKYRIDRDTRTLILKYIRKYDEYRKWYQCERDRIVYPTIKPYDGTPRTKNRRDPVVKAAEALERLEGSHRVKVLKAIDRAKRRIGSEIEQTREQEETLRRCVWLSCVNPAEYPFETFAGVVACERAQFYRYKNKFLNDIKTMLGI